LDHFVKIYQKKAAAYHELIAAEDVDGNLRSALQKITSFADSRILDVGGGTGRIPLLIADQANEVLSIDLHRDMLREQIVQREAFGGNWWLAQADLRQLPVATNWADAVIAGWAIGHFRSWHADDWTDQVDRAVAELQRSAKPQGQLIILETMGTGSDAAGPPTPGLAEYYSRLEDKHDFQRKDISTDYEFANLDKAVELTEFFFGEELAEKVRTKNWVRVPEWTGIWYRRNS